ncbi:MAG: tRNA (adenosine(37)-N6)-threonylcarbamoyltransferase complex ATPase subunit type 1 TsaE [Hyphomicrobiales bacterium]|nr:tRNA (adenosine(37)-N6)-threonylcarbamoyltransferase complex ATPase subunit type 1 TsaE [Rickettsiales bacterium]MCP5361880.1 tRNA (adenosine(37)-N6)-threonylcarbamoyltransferase complex ATPase subunit type 1 TsaE [Hyphomicrobiales bacterium]
MFSSHHILTNQQEAEQFVTQHIVPALQPGDVVCMEGTLGAGKTTLARAMIHALCTDTTPDVTSPTFALLHVYDSPRAPIYHFDLYRLKHVDELWELGLEDALNEGISFIEWPEIAANYLPEARLQLKLTYGTPETEERILHIEATGAIAKRLTSLKDVA